MTDINKLIKDEREGNKGRAEWLKVNARQKALTWETGIDCASMLEGAISTIDRLLLILDGAIIGVDVAAIKDILRTAEAAAGTQLSRQVIADIRKVVEGGKRESAGDQVRPPE